MLSDLFSLSKEAVSEECVALVVRRFVGFLPILQVRFLSRHFLSFLSFLCFFFAQSVLRA